MDPARLKPCYWGDAVADVQNTVGSPLFKHVELNWTKPVRWEAHQRVPQIDETEPFVYALVRNHWSANTRDQIAYIGLTQAPRRRFGNHERAREIVDRRGSAGLTYARIDFVKGRDRVSRVHRALEEIEHLLIWAVWEHLENARKLFTLPGMGTHPGNAWHITNTGYRFSGRMPRDIVYPWMLVRPGRDRTTKTSS